MTKTVEAALADPSIIELIAEACHEANREHCVSIGDNSQLPWVEAPQWQKESAINGVIFTLSNPDAGDSANHDNWSAVKLADGWTYGPVKDADAKTHPCLVPFDQLPAEQQEKDRIFRRTVFSTLGPDTVEPKSATASLDVPKPAKSPKGDKAAEDALWAKALQRNPRLKRPGA